MSTSGATTSVATLPRPPRVASIGTMPNQGVRAVLYGLDGTSLGENWFSTTTSFLDAQFTGPSGLGWHHAFPGGVPERFEVKVVQLPVDSFVLYSFSLPPGVSCSVSGEG